MEVFCETERMILRRFSPNDLEDLVALDNDPEVMFFINAGAPVARSEVEDDLRVILARQHGHLGFGIYAAVDKTSHAFLGWFHLRPGEGAGPTEPELGYRLVQKAWGRGLATEGSVALVDKAFSDLGATRVYAESMTVNYASRRVMEKVGLRYRRTFRADWPVRIPGDEHGDVEYAITREEWAGRQRAG